MSCGDDMDTEADAVLSSLAADDLMEGMGSNVEAPRASEEANQNAEKVVDDQMDHDGDRDTEASRVDLMRRPRDSPTPSNSKRC